MKTACTLIVALLALGASSASADGHYSGFLDDYSKLTPDSGRPGAKIYLAEGISLGRYDKIALTPIEMWLSPDSKYKGLSADDMKALTDAFTAEIVAALEPAYPVVSAPGSGVLQARIAIANVTLKKKKRGLLSFTPAGFALTTLKDIAGKRIILDNAVIEVELTDAESGAIVGLLVDELAVSTSEDESEDSWAKLQKAFQFYAKRFRARLDAAR
ncbi:MAG: DUF3313 domain-containing protein [Gammaproteobacteria bacterium]